MGRMGFEGDRTLSLARLFPDSGAVNCPLPRDCTAPRLPSNAHCDAIHPWFGGRFNRHRVICQARAITPPAPVPSPFGDRLFTPSNSTKHDQNRKWMIMTPCLKGYVQGAVGDSSSSVGRPAVINLSARLASIQFLNILDAAPTSDRR